MTSTSTPIAGLVLAAGASSRMGEPKLAMELGGKTLLARTVERLRQGGAEPILVVVRSGAGPESLGPGVKLVENPEPERGLSSSLSVGIEALPPEAGAVLVALADKPLVRPETVRRLIETYRSAAYAIVYPTHEGEQGHPVIWDRALFEELRALTGDRGGRALIARHREAARAVEVDDIGVCLDIDTGDDYARARELVKEERQEG